MANKTLILTIDGGGIRGVIPAYILTQIEAQLGKQCHQLFDIIGGTSTGGIISAGLTTPNPADASGAVFTAEALLSIYKTKGDQIFVSQGWGLVAATYYGDDGSGNGVEPFLQHIVGPSVSLTAAQAATTQLPGNRVQQMFTTAYIINSDGDVVPNPVEGKDYGPILFNWYDAAHAAGCDYRVWEAARGTSAAPVYFPVAQVGGGSGQRSNMPQKWVVDGGVMSNDPAVWAFTEAFRLGLAQNLSDITIISLGTGIYPGANGAGIHNNAGDVYYDNGNWGLDPWVTGKLYDLEGNESRGTLINVIMESVQQVSDAQLSALVKGGLQYYRLEPIIPSSLSAMDDISHHNIEQLEKHAKHYLESEGKETFNKVLGILKGL